MLPRALFVVPGSVHSASARYRCTHIAEALRLAGWTAEVVSATENAAIRIEHDVVVLHRMGWNGMGERIVRAARAIGAAVVYGADDLIFEPEHAFQIGLAHSDDPPRFRYHRHEAEEALRCLLACDAALVSTEFLAARSRHAFAEAGCTDRGVWVVRNFLSAEIMRLSEAARARRPVGFPITDKNAAEDRVTLGYLSGSPTHDADLADLAPALADTFAKHADARLLIVGPVALPPALRSFWDDGRIRRHPFVDWRDLPALLSGIDLNLAPLDTARVFNHAKSEVKFLEAGAVGVPTLASAAIGFAEGVHEGEDCVLVHRIADWPTTLERFAAAPVERRSLGEHALDAVCQRGTVQTEAEPIAAAFAAFAGFGSGGVAQTRTVRPSLRELGERGFRGVEETTLRRLFRLSRHLRLLRDEAG